MTSGTMSNNYVGFPEAINVNSMLYWFPLIEKTGVRHPKTFMVRLDQELIVSAFMCIYEEEEYCKKLSKLLPQLIDELDNRITRMFGYPVFMRSDFTSCKHHPMKPTIYRVNDPSEFKKKIPILIAECHEPSKMTFFNPPVPNALVIREWINISKWTCRLPRFYGNIEVRVFTEKNHITRVIPYYHITGIRSHLKRYYNEALEREYKERYIETIITHIGDLLIQALKILSSEEIIKRDWSLDFALVDNRWYFIDMALARNSWKPTEYTPEDDQLMEAVKEWMRNNT